MKKVFLEYVWLDGNQPQQLRSKTKVVVKPERYYKILLSKQKEGFAWDLPKWSFDGSSTKQAQSWKRRKYRLYFKTCVFL